MRNPQEHRPTWRHLDSVLSSGELSDFCRQLGFGPPIWHETDRFLERIESSIDESTIEDADGYRLMRGEEGQGDGTVLLTDPDAFRLVLEEAEDFFKRCAKSARNTQEFDEVVQLLRNILELLGKQKPIQASMIIDLIDMMWCGKNWECLLEPLRERKEALDGVLRDIGIAKEELKVCELHGGRSYSLAKAAQTYVANDWMHTRWLTTLLAREMLSDLEFSLRDRLKTLQKWGTILAVATLVLGYFTRFWGIVLIVACGGVFARVVWIAYTQSVERIIGEVQSGFYSGRVLAERLERLNRFRRDVPSILTGVLLAQPTAWGRKDPGAG